MVADISFCFRLRAEELMLLNCGVGEDSWESLGQQGDPASPSWRNSVLIFIGRNDAEAEAPILWPPDVKSWLTRKDPDAGKDWRQDEKGKTEGEMVGWHHRLDGHESVSISGSWWRTGRPSKLQSTWLQRVRHDWVTTELKLPHLYLQHTLGRQETDFNVIYFYLAVNKETKRHTRSNAFDFVVSVKVLQNL